MRPGKLNIMDKYVEINIFHNNLFVPKYMLNNSFLINVSLGFIFGLPSPDLCPSGNHSPEVQQLRAHRGVQVCQPHPVVNTQRRDEEYEVSSCKQTINKSNYRPQHI